MASLLKGLLGGQGSESQPSGAEIIEKLKNRYFDLRLIIECTDRNSNYAHNYSCIVNLYFTPKINYI